MKEGIKNVLNYIVIIVITFVYFTFKYLPYEVQIIFPVFIGIFIVSYGIYMIKHGQTLFQSIAIMILGISVILVGTGHYALKVLNNYNYGHFILIIIFILMDFALILRIVDIYKNQHKENFKILRNTGIVIVVVFISITIGLIFLFY